jgi:hypothetical protein
MNVIVIGGNNLFFIKQKMQMMEEDVESNTRN